MRCNWTIMQSSQAVHIIEAVNRNLVKLSLSEDHVRLAQKKSTTQGTSTAEYAGYGAAAFGAIALASVAIYAAKGKAVTDDFHRV